MSSVWTVENLLRIRGEIRDRHPQSAPERLESFHDRAALLSSFVIDPSIHVGEAGVNLAADSIPAAGARTGEWTLKSHVRRRVLARLRSVDALRAALNSTPNRPTDVLQRAIEGWLLGTAVTPIEKQSPQELTHYFSNAGWVT